MEKKELSNKRNNQAKQSNTGSGLKLRAQNEDKKKKTDKWEGKSVLACVCLFAMCVCVYDTVHKYLPSLPNECADVDFKS